MQNAHLMVLDFQFRNNTIQTIGSNKRNAIYCDSEIGNEIEF